MTPSPVRVAASAVAALPLATLRDPASAIAEAAARLLPHLERGLRIDAAMLRAAMEAAFGASDAAGAWDWKSAYEACEAATVLFLRKFGPAMQARAATPAARLAMLAKVAGLLPTHTRRSEESQALQQFSTPIPLGFCAAVGRRHHPGRSRAGALGRHGSSCDNGRDSRGGSLALNELADTRAELLARLFSRPVRHALRCGADRRSSRRRHPPKRRSDEPVFFGDGACRSTHVGRRDAPYPLGAGTPYRGRASGRNHGGELGAGRSRLE